MAIFFMFARAIFQTLFYIIMCGTEGPVCVTVWTMTIKRVQKGVRGTSPPPFRFFHGNYISIVSILHVAKSRKFIDDDFRFNMAT